MILIYLLLIVLLFFVYTKRNKMYYVLLFALSAFSFFLFKINPDVNQNYNLRQIIYLIDNFNFIIFIILSILINILLIFIIFDKTKKIKHRVIYSIISVLGIFFLFFFLLAVNIFIIKEPLKNHFEGYVFDERKKPMFGVKVIESKSDNNYVLTDEKGFFKLKRKKEIDNESNLAFIKKGYRESYIVIKVARYHPNSSYFTFLRRDSDTLIMTPLFSDKKN
jgi:hypothetical protein